jgi:TonB family protein
MDAPRSSPASAGRPDDSPVRSRRRATRTEGQVPGKLKKRIACCRRPARRRGRSAKEKQPKTSASCFTLLPAMNRKTSFLFLAVLLFQTAIAHVENIKDALNQKYKNQILALRSPFTSGRDQKFDTAGQSLDTAPSSGWLLYGGIYVEKLNLSADTLRLEGPRAALANKNGQLMLVRFSKTQDIEIHLNHPLKSLEDADALMARIFFPSADAASRAWPEWRRADGNTPGDEIYHVGNGTSPPRPIYTPEPEFSEEARHARFQGVVVMTVVVNKAGNIVRIKLQIALGKGLDENAMEGVKSWRFDPATRNGQPVAVEMNIEVAFNLYSKPSHTH